MFELGQNRKIAALSTSKCVCFFLKKVIVMCEKYMKEALVQANKAYKKEEVPIGTVIVKDGKIIAKAYNQMEHKKKCTCHAEILAIEKASKKIGNWRLNGCSIYITLQPCLMCLGAIVQARIKKIVYAADSTYLNEQDQQCFEYICKKNEIVVEKNIYKTESVKLLQNFFKKKRK